MNREKEEQTGKSRGGKDEFSLAENFFIHAGVHTCYMFTLQYDADWIFHMKLLLISTRKSWELWYAVSEKGLREIYELEQIEFFFFLRKIWNFQWENWIFQFDLLNVLLQRWIHKICLHFPPMIG